MIDHVEAGSQTVIADLNIETFGSQAVEDHGIIYGNSAGLDTSGTRLSFGGDKRRVRTCTLSSLRINKTYYLRGYIKSADNTVTYSPEVSTTTQSHNPQIFYPRRASIYDEVTILGMNFSPGGTTVFVNDVPVDAEVTPTAIKFFPPFGIQTDSSTISVEVDGVKIPLPTKLDYVPGKWTRLRPYEDEQISFVSMGVGAAGKVYVTSVNDFIKPTVIREFDPAIEQWTDVAVRQNLKNRLMQWFAIQRQLFIVADNDAFVMYDLDAGLWHELPPHPVGSWQLYTGVSFSLNDNGYVALGGARDRPNHEVWRYNDKDFWTQVSDFPGKGTSMGLVLSTTSEAYYFGGMYYTTEGVVLYKETWKYDPLLDMWEEKSAYPGKGSIRLNGISLNNKLYVGGGGGASDGSIVYNDFWEYDPQTDRWQRIVDLPVSRLGMYTYSYGNDAYLGSGMTEAYRWYHDVWKFEVE